ncbi:hypothetical protein WN943_010850 [Citrus x changshan-huyou]
MGGSHHNKANNNGSRSSSSSSGKPYGLMLLLAFGPALLGVMVLRKLRERRIFTLLVKEKDSQLISLQLLFQKEREHGKEMKRKNEEMKVKLYSLRTQKMELDRRLLEMQSTIDSLKDEQKALESALEEKQNEIKMQREQIDASKENSQLIVLKEILKQRVAEIKDLRHQLEYRVNVWSVSADDPSNPRVSLTDTSNVLEKDKSESSSSKEAGGRLHDSAKFNDGISQDEGFKNGGGIQGKGINEGEGKRKNIGNSTEQIVDDQATVLKPRDDSSEVKGDLQHTITGEWESEKPENSQDEKQEVQATSKGGIRSWKCWTLEQD